MEPFEHGGDVYSHPGVLDFSASLNPLGMPAAAREALLLGVDGFERYPDPACRELTQALATFEEVPREWVLACAGATDAFARLCLALMPRQALVCDPCYSGYEQALRVVGCHIDRHALSPEEGFALTPSFAKMIDTGVGLVFIANPNNPTGRCVERHTLHEVLEAARAVGARVVVDECFVDLSDGQGSVDFLDMYDNLVVVKALTKTFALAGLRVGYVLSSDEALLGRLREVGQPWAVSVPAQVAGVAALGEHDYLRRSRAVVRSERTMLMKELTSLGVHVLDSEANYLLFQGGEGLRERLLARGILIRSCDNFVGLDCTWYRIAVRTPPKNAALLAALREVV